jgi:hypothetical protein
MKIPMKLKNTFNDGKFRISSMATIQAITAVASIGYLINGFLYSGQELIDLHHFRQTQTALVTEGILKSQGPFFLTNSVPVLGPPWEVPFDFPIYQFMVSWFSSLSGIGVSQSGRLLNVLLGLALVHPTHKIFKAIGVSSTATLFLAILTFTSSQYLYWSRTFLIENTALLLSLYGVYFSIKAIQSFGLQNQLYSLVLFTLAALQKVTTALPVILALIVLNFLHSSGLKGISKVKKLTKYAAPFILPILVSQLWVVYSDGIKEEGLLSKYMTSASLSGWNFGTFAQRFSADLWVDVILKRVILGNAGAGIAFILLVTYLIKFPRNQKYIVTFLLMFLLPTLIFPNLHIVHTYYQSANLIFLLMAISIALEELTKSKMKVTVALILITSVSNLAIFSKYYLPFERLKKEDTIEYLIAQELKSVTSKESIFISYGLDWDPTVSYLSSRDAVMFPNWYPNYDRAIVNPLQYSGKKKIGAMILCQSSDQDLRNIEFKLTTTATELNLMKIRKVRECLIYSRKNSG